MSSVAAIRCRLTMLYTAVRSQFVCQGLSYCISKINNTTVLNFNDFHVNWALTVFYFYEL